MIVATWVVSKLEVSVMEISDRRFAVVEERGEANPCTHGIDPRSAAFRKHYRA